jgi:hypothetical protein
MAKHKSEDAFNARMRQLANIKGTSSLNENRSLGTLIDVKRTADGVAYGIVKENHQYYIKKGGLKENPSVADFAYIGGLSNITEHQYPSLATADKNRNFLLATINESLSTKVSKTGSKKKVLNEDNAEKEIAAASKKVDDLEAATDAAAVADVPSEPVDDGGEEEMAAGIEDMPTDEPAPEGGEEAPAPEVDIDMAPEGGEEAPEGGEEEMDVAPEGGEEPAPEGGEEAEVDIDVAPEGGEEEESTGTGNLSDSLMDKIGSAADEIRKEDIDATGTAWLLGTFLSAFKSGGDDDPSKNKFRQLGEKEREDYADMIQNVTSDEEKQSVADTVPQDGDEEMEEGKGEGCNECGGFKEYAESRGYTAESLMECGDEEMANLMSGYANAHGEGQNDGDFQIVALLATPEILEKLRSEYGHEEFAGQVEPIVTGMDDETKQAELNELFGGLKNLGKAAGQGIKQGAQNLGQNIADKAGQVKQAVGQAATNVKQTYHAGELGGEVKKLEKAAANLGSQVDSLNKRMQKAGGQPVNLQSILTTIKNQVGGAKGVDLSKYGSVQEEGPEVPTDSLEVQPNMVESSDDVKSEEDFREYAVTVLKKAHGEDYDTDKAEYMIKGLVNMTKTSDEENWGDAIGILQQSLDETSIEEAVDIKVSEKQGKKLSAEKAPEVEMKEGEEKFEIGAGFDSMGAGVVKPESVPVTEAEIKLRKYVRNRLEEKAGMRKPVLNENKKSETLLKLDRVIDKQLGLFENAAMNEIMGFSVREKFGKMNPNDPGQVEKLFNKAFSDILINPQMGAIARAAKTTPTETKYEILKQYVDNNGGTLRLADRDTVKYATQQEKDTATPSSFSHGGTQGRTQWGGTAG